MFSEAVMEKLESYVYYLEDPRDGKVFYVGKGKGNRLFDHLNGAIWTDAQSEKLDRIREIQNAGHEVGHYILRHGLTDKAAFEVEAAMLDFLGIGELANIQGGRYSGDFGMKRADEIAAMYEADELKTDEPIILININRRYRRDMTPDELYEATRSAWVVGNRRNSAKYAVATYHGLTREVYEIRDWYQPDDRPRRWAFNGVRAQESVRETLVYKSIVSYFQQGAANPIKYVNC